MTATLLFAVPPSVAAQTGDRPALLFALVAADLMDARRIGWTASIRPAALGRRVGPLGLGVDVGASGAKGPDGSTWLLRGGAGGFAVGAPRTFGVMPFLFLGAGAFHGRDPDGRLGGVRTDVGAGLFLPLREGIGLVVQAGAGVVRYRHRAGGGGWGLSAGMAAFLF